MIVRFVGSNLWRFLLKEITNTAFLDDGLSTPVDATNVLIMHDQPKKVAAECREHGSNHASIS